MDENKLQELKEKWYSNTGVKYEIIKDSQAKEIVFIQTKGKEAVVRCIKAHQVTYLEKNMEAFGFNRKPYNIYVSLANFMNMPMFSFNMKERLEQQDEFNKKEEFMKYLQDYDFFLDFDPPKGKYQEETKKQLIKVHELLNEYNVRHWIQFSGKGFQIIIKGEEFNWLKTFNKPAYYQKLAKRIKAFYATHIDTGIYTEGQVWRRVRKMAYSLDMKTGRIALPLNTEEEIKNFNLEMVQPQNILPKIFKRGITIHNQNKPTKILEICENIMSD